MKHLFSPEELRIFILLLLSVCGALTAERLITVVNVLIAWPLNHVLDKYNLIMASSGVLFFIVIFVVLWWKFIKGTA